MVINDGLYLPCLLGQRFFVDLPHYHNCVVYGYYKYENPVAENCFKNVTLKTCQLHDVFMCCMIN